MFDGRQAFKVITGTPNNIEEQLDKLAQSNTIVKFKMTTNTNNTIVCIVEYK